MENGSSNKTVWVVVGLVAVALLVWWMMSSKTQEVSPVINESTASISGELDGLNDADMNAEFKDVDQDVSQL